jgi:hypothetical protein
MKRLVRLKHGWLELDIRTYRQLPRFFRRVARFPGGYTVLLTRYGSDGWSVGDPESPWEIWSAGTDTKLETMLVDFVGITLEEADTIVAETIAEWHRRDPDADGQ